MYFHSSTLHLEHTSVVRCKRCEQSIPTQTSGVPSQPVVIPCSFCGERRQYLPSEVFLGRPSPLARKAGR